jgi:hypothetical protein
LNLSDYPGDFVTSTVRQQSGEFQLRHFDRSISLHDRELLLLYFD